MTTARELMARFVERTGVAGAGRSLFDAYRPVTVASPRTADEVSALVIAPYGT